MVAFFSIKIKIRYDENFADKFGDDAVNTIRRVVTQVIKASFIFNKFKKYIKNLRLKICGGCPL